MAAEGAAPNEQDLYLGLFPKGQSFTEDSIKVLQDLLNKRYSIVEGASPLGIELLNMLMFADIPDILGPQVFLGHLLEVINQPYLTPTMIKTLDFNEPNTNLVGLINMERVNKNLRIKQPHFIRRLQERLSIIRQEWEDLGEQIKATGPAAQEDLTIRRNGLYRLLTVAENATVNDKYLYSSIGDDLPFKTLAEAQEKFRSYKASAEASGATKILLPVNKRYIRLNKRNSMGIDQIQSSHANHLLIDLATKKYMLIEPQMPVYDHTKKMSEQFLIWAHYRILDRLGDDLIKPVFGDEFESVEVARRSCPQSIVRDKNCIWWSFMLTYLYISNMETTDINYIGKKIVSKYGAELPDLMNSFKVFCVGRILKVVKGDPGWAILMDSEFVRGLQGLTLAAAGGGRTKLMRRGRSTRKHHTKRHGKRTLRSS